MEWPAQPPLVGGGGATPSVYSLDKCFCRQIPLREIALLSYRYDPGRMLAACPLTPVWSSLTDHPFVGGKLYSWSVVCP